MKRTALLLLLLAVTLSCGSISVKTVQKNADALAAVKKAGLVVRLPRDVRISREDYMKTISHWVSGLKSRKDLLLLSDASEKISMYDSDDDRFYQMAEDDSFFKSRGGHTFLKYKSLGVVNMYLKNSGTELKQLMEANSLEGIFIYEIYGVLSTEMQFVDYDTALVLADKNLNVVYMDRQHYNEDTSEIDFDRIKIKFLDSVCDRLTRTLVSLGFLEK